jgi:hypothetical protein
MGDEGGSSLRTYWARCTAEGAVACARGIALTLRGPDAMRRIRTLASQA